MEARPKFFKNCPICKAETPPGSINCPTCGVDLEIARQNMLKDLAYAAGTYGYSVAQQERQPKVFNDGWFIVISIVVSFVAVAAIIAVSLASDVLGAIFLLSFVIFYMYTSTIGRYGKVSFYGVINIWAMSAIPGVNFYVIYYFGRGLYLTYTKQELLDPPIATSFWTKVLAIGLVVAYIVFLIDTSDTPSAPVPTAIPRAAVVPAATRTPRPKPTPTQACLLWSQVTPQMEGRQVCVYGTVYDYRENWDDYLSYLYFGRRDQFFLVSVFRWNDSPEGQCVTVDGMVELNTYKVPYIKFKDLYFCDSPSPNF